MDWTSKQKGVLRQIKAKGADMTIAYPTITGSGASGAAPTWTPLTVKALIIEADDKMIEAGVLSMGDKVVYIAASDSGLGDNVPKKGWRITDWGGGLRAVKRVKEINPSGTPLLYILYVGTAAGS